MNLRDSKFLISCAARTGSTFLVHLLRSNPQILAHGEALNIEKVGAILGSYDEKRRKVFGYEESLYREMMRHPERFIQSCIFDTQRYAVVGFKFKTDEAFDTRYRRFADVLFADTDIKVVHLQRRNLLAQYISHQVVLQQTSVTLVHEGSARPEIRPFKCDPRHAVQYFADVVDRERRAISAYGNHRSIRVEYESLTDGESPEHADIQRFLGVEVRPLKSTTKKIIRDSRALVTNLEETLSALEDAGFGDRLTGESVGERPAN